MASTHCFVMPDFGEKSYFWYSELGVFSVYVCLAGLLYSFVPVYLSIILSVTAGADGRCALTVELVVVFLYALAVLWELSIYIYLSCIYLGLLVLLKLYFTEIGHSAVVSSKRVKRRLQRLRISYGDSNVKRVQEHDPRDFRLIY